MRPDRYGPLIEAHFTAHEDTARGAATAVGCTPDRVWQWLRRNPQVIVARDERTGAAIYRHRSRWKESRRASR